MTPEKEQTMDAYADQAEFGVSDAEVKETKLSVHDGEIFLAMLSKPSGPNEALLKAAERYRSSVMRK